MIEKLSALPRVARLKVIANAAHRYISHAKNRTDAAQACFYILHLLLRWSFGDRARKELPVPAISSWQVKHTKVADRFTELLIKELHNYRFIVKQGARYGDSPIYKQISEFRRLPQNKMLRQMDSMPEFKGVYRFLYAAIQLVRARSTAGK